MEGISRTLLPTLVLLSLLVCYALFHPRPFLSKPGEASALPKQIWTYLPSPPTDAQIKRFRSWQTQNPSWTLHILTPDTVRGFLHHLPDLHQAPLFRDPDRWQEIVLLTALEEHGGVWLDPNTEWKESLDHLLPEPKELAGFYDPTTPTTPTAPTCHLLDKRVLAVISHHPLIQQWRSEYLRLLAFPSVEAYLQSLPKPMEPVLASLRFPCEWVLALALQHVLLAKPYPMESLHLLPAGGLKGQ